MHYSPQIAILEALTCTLMLIFYIWHSWHYDRFQPMLRRKNKKTLHSDPEPRNSFHLIMRFIYLFGLPLCVVQGVTVAYIKYQVGYLPVEMGGYPVPYTSWPPNHVRLINTIYYLKALGWSGEGIVHLEELAFWIFLIHLKETSPPWFKSSFFQAFILLSIASTGTLISIVSILKSDVMLTEGVLMSFATGFNLSVTCGFFWVFSKFPAWLKDLKKRGAPAELLIRLHGFGTLNEIRMIFRLIFTAPLLALSVDGLMPQPFLNKQIWVVDLVSMTSVVAFAAQGIITLLIFLPRNLSKECGFNMEESKGRTKGPSNLEHKALNRSSESFELSREHSTSIKQGSSLLKPILSSPSTTMAVTVNGSSEKQKYSKFDVPPLNRHTSVSPSHPFSLSEYGRNGRRSVNSAPNETSCSTPLKQKSSINNERKFDRSCCLQNDSAEPFAQSTSQAAEAYVQFNPGNKLDASPTFETDRLANFPGERKNQPDHGNSISFPITSPLTHFPRYFAPSQTRSLETCDTDQTVTSISPHADYSQQPLPLSTQTSSQPTEHLLPIHPAIRNFKSPINICSTSLPDKERSPWND
ncbi:hypothetical protein PTTG_00855 [Puccinia triticina 1-1 BBBD Race 1]|uniref:Uncharacterized protein n=2 Tax=Puccinia triticina TaxID=208348 RepID=A0A180GM42_PUCT1|nr:uncharacterized protein PtA15_3A605 [Puccinia triticina]OAV93538.1 hypothetical protein PTTG_00855 [Puccinia triticina 1-1 BBBD Race 1]WAQ83236.1 hypothetical protein PtA15_3A605 [Puccinia triticina]WAR54085.1 hypothetical protein PtB15_3B595 [Puccinia triticina]